jgi:3-hydroxypropanoate dehydrogenase
MRTIESIFNDRTCYKFLNKPVSQELLTQIYDLMKLGPTSGNSCPLRIVFVQSEAEKEKLCKVAAEYNVDKVKSAPVTALFAYDLKFYEQMDKLHPTGKALRDLFASSETIALDTATRNSTLQAAYFMIIARGMGLDCGPMSGFDANGVNETFFKNTNYKINFICNLGYRDGENPYPRLPRMNFEEFCKVV